MTGSATGSETSIKSGIKAKENQHFKKIEALNTAAKNFRTGNFEVFEEFRVFETPIQLPMTWKIIYKGLKHI